MDDGTVNAGIESNDRTRWPIGRRDVLRAVGAGGLAGILSFGGTATAERDGTIDAALDTATDDLREVLVTFDRNADVDRLRHLDLAAGYHAFEVLPIGYAKLTGAQIATVATWPEVRYVQANTELEYHNDDARETTAADAVQAEFGYTGSGVHAVVIDSGVDGDHPDLDENLVANWRYVNPLSDEEGTTWVRAGGIDTDDNGHGTHTSGSVAGTGAESDGEFRGMAPDADLTVYSAGLTLLIVKPVAAFDHVLARQRAGETDVSVVSNSWGATGGADFDPDDAVNVATWYAFVEGILPVFSAGNDGPETNTLNPYAAAPHVLGVAATNDDRAVVDFSSRGRTPEYDGATNWDRKKALDNLAEYHAADKTETEVDSGTHAGTVGPTGTGSAFHRWEAPKKTGYVEASLSWTPSAEDIDFYLREGSEDGPIVASGATLNEPEELASAIEGGRSYYFEARPFANVAAEYEIEFSAYEGIDRNVHPMGVYRPGVGAPGELVMSTLEPTDPLQAYGAAEGEPDTLAWYGRISGTSMSCPVVSGVVTLAIDAYRQNNDGSPDPIAVLNTLEATAEDVHEGYTPWNIGAGFVDAVGAVERAEDGRWAPFGGAKLVDHRD